MNSNISIAMAIADLAAQHGNDMVYAIRSDDARKSVGGICRRSIDMADSSPTYEKRLPGTSGTLIGEVGWIDYTDSEEVLEAVDAALAANAAYIGKHKYIIAGYTRWAHSGDDSREVVLSMDHPDCFGRDYRGAQVVAIIA